MLFKVLKTENILDLIHSSFLKTFDKKNHLKILILQVDFLVSTKKIHLYLKHVLIMLKK